METLAYSLSSDSPGEFPDLLLPDLTPALSVLGVTSGLWVTLVSTGIPMASATLSRGDRCDSVTKLQEALVKAGFDPGKVDGDFGGSTEYAVQRFQEKNKLTADRVVGQSTATALGLESGIACQTAAAKPAATAPATKTTPAATTSTTTPATTPAKSGETVPVVTVPVKFGRVTTTGTDLNVRSGPGTSYGIVKTIANGTLVRFVGQPVDSWLQLVEGGWIHSDWVKFVNPSTSESTPAAQDKSTTKTTTPPTKTTTTQTTTPATGNSSSSTSSTSSTSATAPIQPASTVLKVVKVNTGGALLNVRKEPNLNADVLSQVVDQKELTILAPKDEQTLPQWVQVTTGGWVSSTWLEVQQTVTPKG